VANTAGRFCASGAKIDGSRDDAEGDLRSDEGCGDNNPAPEVAEVMVAAVGKTEADFDPDMVRGAGGAVAGTCFTAPTAELPAAFTGVTARSRTAALVAAASSATACPERIGSRLMAREMLRLCSCFFARVEE
jgi:hypothetical protein